MSHNPRVSLFATLTHDESIDTPLSITNANGTFYYHRDHQGSIVALTDSTGAVVESFAYDNHYGAIINRTKTVETNNPYGYTGREVDARDLYYYRARYYDPTIQRFISEDPIGFASGDFNRYRYVNDDPVDLVDPLGLFKWPWDKEDPAEELVKQSYCTAWQLKGDSGCDQVAFNGHALCLSMASVSIKTCQNMYLTYYNQCLHHELDCQKQKSEKDNNESCDINSN